VAKQSFVDEAWGDAHHPVVRLILGIILATTSVAHADRFTTFTVGASYAADPSSSHESGGPVVELAWEHAPPVMPAAPGYNTAGALVPELIGGALADGRRAQFFLGAGLRVELDIAQREQGLMKVSAKCALYAAGRALVIGKDRDPAVELALGDYFYVARSIRLGGEVAVMMRRDAQDSWSPKLVATGFVGFAL